MSAINFISPREYGAKGAWRYAGKRRRNLFAAEVRSEDRAQGGVRVAVLTSAGAPMLEKTGFVSPDSERCYLSLFGERVQATQENGRWVYRVPKREDE